MARCGAFYEKFREMTERRISTWFLISGVFIIAIFGLFFTITEKKSWPEHKVELSATDMKLVPSASTVWCESLSLRSEHPFVAYQVNSAPDLDPSFLARQTVDLRIKLNRNDNIFKLSYFLLRYSVFQIRACSSIPGVHLAIFKDEKDIETCLKYFQPPENDDSSSGSGEYDYTEEYSVEMKTNSSQRTLPDFKKCDSLISYRPVDSYVDRDICASFTKPVHVNVTDDGTYAIALVSSKTSNRITFHFVLDRARYVLRKSGNTFDMCSLSNSCTIALGFGSEDRALVWIPEEQNAGRTAFVVRAQCKPRLALFAILSVCIPVMLFLLFTYVMRLIGPKRIFGPSERGPRVSQAPLLFMPSIPPIPEEDVAPPEESPPSYTSLYDPPPPYACLNLSEPKK